MSIFDSIRNLFNREEEITILVGDEETPLDALYEAINNIPPDCECTGFSIEVRNEETGKIEKNRRFRF